MKKIISLLIFIIIVLCYKIFDIKTAPKDSGIQNDSGSYKTYRAMDNLQRETGRIGKYWKGKGIVITGKLEVPNDAEIASRVPLYNDNSYCTALYPRRKLIYFAHSYNPLEITDYTPVAPNVYDAGTSKFVKALPKDLRTLSGKVVAKNTTERSSKIHCALHIYNKEYLWNDAGYSGGAQINVNVDSATIDSGMPFAFNNLSRLPYVLIISSPGFIKKQIKIDKAIDGFIDLEKIKLVPSASYRIKHKVRIKQNGKWVDENKIRTSTVECNGTNTFSYTKLRDGFGNRLDLRLRPSEKGVETSFSFRRKNSFFDLGELASNELPNWGTVDTSNLKGDTKALLKDGHTYYFTIDDVNSTSIQLLFQVEHNKAQ